jgi:hypothetical protein
MQFVNPQTGQALMKASPRHSVSSMIAVVVLIVFAGAGFWFWEQHMSLWPFNVVS